MIPYSMVKRLIIMIVSGVEENDDNKALIYVKGFRKCEWLADILSSDDHWDPDYEDRDSLRNLILLIQYVENMLRIVRYWMCLKYTIGGHNTRKKSINV